MNYYFELGVSAARRDKVAIHCPFPTGAKREAWLAGYYSVKPPAGKHEWRRAKRGVPLMPA